MTKIPTAEELILEDIEYFPQLENRSEKNWDIVRARVKSLMIEFAKLHVTEALKAAKSKISAAKDDMLSETVQMFKYEDTVLSAYPLTNIK